MGIFRAAGCHITSSEGMTENRMLFVKAVTDQNPLWPHFCSRSKCNESMACNPLDYSGHRTPLSVPPLTPERANTGREIRVPIPHGSSKQVLLVVHWPAIVMRLEIRGRIHPPPEQDMMIIYVVVAEFIPARW